MYQHDGSQEDQREQNRILTAGFHLHKVQKHM